MEAQARHFLRIWLLACLFAAGSFVAFNVFLDPYLIFGMPRVTGLNSRKPSVDTQERLMKAYDVLRAAPRSLILGSSIADFGLDPSNPNWPVEDRPVYNLALAGGGPYTSYRYLQYVIAHRRLALVVMGLDFEFFVNDEESSLDSELEIRLDVDRQNQPTAMQRRQHIRDLVHGAFTIDALTDGIMTLLGNVRNSSSDLDPGGNWNSDGLRRDVRYGTYPRIAMVDLWSMYVLRGRKVSLTSMGQLQSILDLCKSQGTRVVLVINPMHAGHLEIMDILGSWSTYENWKRDLVELTSSYDVPGRQTFVQLWDFSNYDSYSMEPVPRGRGGMHWFWDRIHYRIALGDLIIERLFRPETSTFGELLTPENIDSHLNALRERHHLYTERMQPDIQRIHDLYKLRPAYSR